MKNFLKFATETKFNEYDYFCEESKTDSGAVVKTPKIRGPYIEADAVNENNRLYPLAVVAEAVEKYVDEEINTGGGLGELQHPTDPTINLERVCHKCTSLTQDGKLWIGESIILTGTPSGDIVNSLLKHKARLGMSTRGFVSYVGGTTEEKEDAVNEVEKFIMICVDLVSNPSIGKYLDSAVLESKQYMIDKHGLVVEAAYNTLEDNISKLPRYDKVAQRNIINKAVEKFLNSI